MTITSLRIASKDDLEQARKRGLATLYPARTKIMVGMASCGIAAGATEVYEALRQKVEQTGLEAVVTQTGCIGMCFEEPLVDVMMPHRSRITYNKMTVKKASDLVGALAQGEVKGEWALARMDEVEGLIEGRNYRYGSDGLPPEVGAITPYSELGYYKKQRHIASRNCGFIDPEAMEEYIGQGGYFAAYKALTEMSPEAVIAEVTKSGLRGRGGAGFATGDKWASCRKAHGDVKYVLCNADEGDPGAYMDRSILEGDPHSIIEGMIIGAFAIGAHEGYIYVRHEYPLAVKRFAHALDEARRNGLLGQNIFNTGFDFDIKISRGGGAFVCGESTALMASIEGKIGEPRAKYVHTVERGLWERPSNLNNVETWANVPVIIARGGEWHAQIGTEGSKGTKVFSLVGKIKNTGLIEVPMGITLREIIFDIGGGIPEGKRFKAVQTGGPSGGCIPEQYLDLPVDFDELWKVGSMMGSGGMIVMDEGTCMVDVARYFIDFLTEESCGKCVPCREGLRQMREILVKITQGKGTEDDLKLLERLSPAVRDGSLCGLGQSAPNPVLTTIQYFRDEYRAHIVEKRCPAAVCKDLIHYTIIDEKCPGCSLCIKPCPVNAITFQGKKNPVVIDQSKCTKCGACYDVCRLGAVKVE